MVLISPAVFPKLSILYRGIGEGREIVLILFCFTKLWCIKEEEAPESIIAKVDIFEYPWNMIGILRCYPFAPNIIVEEEEDKKKEGEEMIEEKQFKRNWSAWMALSSDPSENPFDPLAWPLL
jgi:hypothetical protein